jgi:hypothetical protein
MLLLLESLIDEVTVDGEWALILNATDSLEFDSVAANAGSLLSTMLQPKSTNSACSHWNLTTRYTMATTH